LEGEIGFRQVGEVSVAVLYDQEGNKNNGVGATKFICYDTIDKILSHIAKTNKVFDVIDQVESVRRTVAAPVNFEGEGERDGEPAWTRSPDPTILAFAGSENGDIRSTASTSPRIRVANFVECWGQGTSFTAKRAKVDRDVIDILNRMSESTTTIEKMLIEAALLMHKDNLLDCQENQRIELELFKMQ
jgi:hypothetical protein